MSEIYSIFKDQLSVFVGRLLLEKKSGPRETNLQSLADKMFEFRFKEGFVVLGVIAILSAAMYCIFVCNIDITNINKKKIGVLIFVSLLFLFIIISFLFTCVKICKIEKQKQDIYCKLYEAELKNNQYEIGEMVSLYKRMIELPSEGEENNKETLEDFSTKITNEIIKSFNTTQEREIKQKLDEILNKVNKLND